MHDRQYRAAIAWQNSGYNQPPHPSFFLGDGMAPPPTPNIVTSLSTLLGPAAPVFTSISIDAGFSASDFVTNDPTLVLQGTSVPNTTVTVTRFGVGVIGSATADPSGNWAFDYSGTALPNGDTLFTATATDAGNQTGPPTTPFRVTVDLIPPAAPVIVDVADEGSLEFTGTAEPGSVMVDVTLVGTGVIGGSTVDASGNWSFDLCGTTRCRQSFFYRQPPLILRETPDRRQPSSRLIPRWQHRTSRPSRMTPAPRQLTGSLRTTLSY